MQTYYVKLTTKSPLHIGNGEVYELINIFVDDGYLYYFNEYKLYQSLNSEQKREFLKIVSNPLRLINFYNNTCKNYIKNSYLTKIKLGSEKIEKEYKKLKEYKNMEIFTIYKDPNSFLPTIPGSSLKGALVTLLGIFQPNASHLRRKLKISDALILPSNQEPIEIGIAKRKYRESGKERFPIKVEVLKENISFIFKIDVGDNLFNWKKLKEDSFNFYKERLKKCFPEMLNEFLRGGRNSIFLKIGRFSGRCFIVDKVNKIPKTFVVYKNQRFGDVEIENISEKEYFSLLEEHRLFWNERIKGIKDRIRKILEDKERKEKEIKKIREKNEKLREQEIEEAKISNNIEFIEKILVKYSLDPKIEKLLKERVVRLKENKREEKNKGLEKQANQEFQRLVNKKGKKGCEKLKEKFIKKWNKEKNHKNLPTILKLINNAKKFKC
ncbi:MAG: hypothetical protein GXO61_04560 [Epsilonproteobacteria bacterium]|nr:hypothetical protein [Campylobacterota bacterium]